MDKFPIKGKIRKEKMKGIRLHLLVGLVVTLLLVSCSIESNVSTDSNFKTIEIDGMNTLQEVSSDRPIVLIVDGMGSEVTVKRGTPIEKIEINAMNVIVYVPEGATPETEVNGMNSRIEYY